MTWCFTPSQPLRIHQGEKEKMMKKKMHKNGNNNNNNSNNRNNSNSNNDDDEQEGEKEGEKEKCIVSMISKQVSNLVFYAQLTGAVISEGCK